MFRTNGTRERPGPLGSRPAPFRVHDRCMRRSGYRTSSPVTARPMLAVCMAVFPDEPVPGRSRLILDDLFDEA